MVRRLLFLNARRSYARLFVTPAVQARAAALDMELHAPALDGDLSTEYDWRPHLAAADALVTTWSSPMCTAAVLAHAPRVGVVGHAAGSVAVVVDASTYAAGVRVTSSNPVMAVAVAEWSLMATLLAQRNLAAYARLRPGDAPRFDRKADMMPGFSALTVGVWGYGDVARRFLRMLSPLSPGRVLVCDPRATAEELAEAGAVPATLEELLAESDILHCLAGANRENHHRIGPAELALLKDGMTLVNCGRARLFQEQPLLDALRTRPIRAVIDVYHREPLSHDAPLAQLDNVILTPHNAGFPGRERYLPVLLEEFARFFAGEPMHAEVSEERLSHSSDDRLDQSAVPQTIMKTA